MNYELWLIFAHPGKNLPKFLVPRSSFIVTKNPWIVPRIFIIISLLR